MKLGTISSLDVVFERYVSVSDSSFIVSLSYNDEADMMKVVLKNGTTYVYINADARWFTKIAFSKSVGTAFDAFKDGDNVDYFIIDTN